MASGDSRIAANQRCWPAQQALEKRWCKAFGELGARIVRGHAYDADKKHGFIDGQARGMQIFRKIDPDAPLVVAEAVWEYTTTSSRAYQAPRPDPDAGQLERRVAGPCRHVERQRLVDEGRAFHYSSIWSEDLTTVCPRRPAPVARRGPHRARHQPRPGGRRPDVRGGVGGRPRARRGARRRAPEGPGDPRRLRRGLHGDVQRDRPRRAHPPAGLFKERLRSPRSSRRCSRSPTTGRGGLWLAGQRG